MEGFVASELILQPEIKHIILVLTSVSDEDPTAWEALESLNHELQVSPNYSSPISSERSRAR
ncbi:MAG: hypothetical protein WCH01_05400 [Methylococcaceae bacterium]